MVAIPENNINDVHITWEQLKKIPDYKEVAGEYIFLKIFQLAPEARPLFNFSVHEDIRSNARFRSHATAMVDMIDDAVEYLSEDEDQLVHDLQALGGRHLAYGVDNSLFSVMGKAIEHAMSTVLGNGFTTDHRKSWRLVFKFMVEKMTDGYEIKKNSVEKKQFTAEFDTATTHTADNINYGDVMDVTLTWSTAKETENFKNVAGETIFLTVFEVEPAARALFNFGDTEVIKSNPAFWKHAHTMVDMIDCAVAFLGPDLEPLEEDLIELGGRHVAYRVEPKFLPVMGIALFTALDKILGEKFDEKAQASWQKIFQFMISKMVVGIQQHS